MLKFLTNKRILIGITGGIAAYKICTLIRELQEQGAIVKTILTKNAEEFITKTTIHALTGETEITDSMQHITLARWAEVILIAPASANSIAKMSIGLADDLLSTVCLATTAPILVAPAMNLQMWQNPATQHNINILAARNIKILGPNSGSQACGEVGFGRMLEATELLDELNKHFAPKPLHNKHILITAGPTQEPIDPVRFLSNQSSGKMGYALADAALNLGATVTLISGPTQITKPTHKNLTLLAVVTADDMLKASLRKIQDSDHPIDIFIGCAAVADYTPIVKCSKKIKKNTDQITLELKPTTDILHTVATLPNDVRPLTIGFAAETHDLMANAKKKLEAKCLDMIIANAVGDGKAFNQDGNTVFIINKDLKITEFSYKPKVELAYEILQEIALDML